MSEDLSFEIEIPCDDDGFVLHQCPECGEFFKLRVSEIESDDVTEICCPACGIVSDCYFTEDVNELVNVMLKNRVMRALHSEMKDLERKTRGKAVSIKAGRPPKPDEEPALQPSVDALAITHCRNCGMSSKISRLLIMSAYICPLCGVRNFNDR